MGLFDKVMKVGNKVLKDVTSEENMEKAKGFLNSAAEKIGEAAEKAASEENKEKAKEFLGNAGSAFRKAAEDAKNYINDAVKEETPAPAKTEPASETSTVSVRTKLLNVLKGEFPEYAVEENVSPRTMGGTGKFMNYSIVVSKAGTPKLYIMIIGKTTCQHREYRWSKEFAEQQGVALINFIEHYPNEIDYIVNRLHKYL